MAKLKIFAARDSKLGVFMTPFFMMHQGQALRAWEEIVNDEKSVMSKHPADFALYHLGEFDDDSGTVTMLEHHALLGSALEYVKRPQEELGLKAIR